MVLGFYLFFFSVSDCRIIFHYIQIHLCNFLGFAGFILILLVSPVLITLNLIFKPKELWKRSEPESDMQVSCPALVKIHLVLFWGLLPGRTSRVQ